MAYSGNGQRVSLSIVQKSFRVPSLRVSYPSASCCLWLSLCGRLASWHGSIAKVFPHHQAPFQCGTFAVTMTRPGVILQIFFVFLSSMHGSVCHPPMRFPPIRKSTRFGISFFCLLAASTFFSYFCAFRKLRTLSI